MTDEISPQRAMLRALIDRDYQDSAGRAGQVPAHQTLDVITAGFIVALEKHFGREPDMRQVEAYAAELPNKYADGAQNIAPDNVRRLIRTGLGEEGLLDGMSVDEIVDLSVAITYDIASVEYVTEQQRDEFLDMAEAALD